MTVKKMGQEDQKGPESREPPERLNPTMKGQSYAMRKINIDMKRKMKKDIKMRTKKNSEKSTIIYTLRV